MKQKFIKEYTRDNSLIIQEIWYQAHLLDIDGNQNPNFPPIIFYLVDGVVEIWHNHQAIQWYQNQLLKKNQSDPDFFSQAMTKYYSILKELQKYWDQKYLKSISELKDFVRLVDQGAKYFSIFYYSAIDSRTPSKINQQALKIRKVDTYYDDTNRLIANTLSNLKPKIKDLNITVITEDLDFFPNLIELKQRWQNLVFIPGKKFEKIKLKEFLKINLDYEFQFEKIENNNFIKGQSAYLGKVKGRIKIIKRKSQVNEIKEGDILVSPMTTPEFILAMKKASAFITDEGGITCHAAIIAREMKKPCIIGTKIATQVLKDGDLVEVDANQGIVRKLNK
ncbi:hypothetical protein K8R66_00475 [bacterium]|nr:hypothetical protein [bacterium]